MSNYIQNIYSNGDAFLEDNMFDGIFAEYERVVVESIITSFGLDAFFSDKHGGDVDTIHNVRMIGLDPRMTYKNKANEAAYNNRGEYNNGTYHGNPLFSETKRKAKEQWLEDYKDIEDAYTGGNVGFHGHTKAIPPEMKAELDHIVECKGIHDDRGRVLSGLKGEDLANQPDNYAWTNKGLNASMGSWARQVNDKYRKEHGCDAPLSEVDARAYVKAHPDMDEKTKKNLLEHYNNARKNYEAKINRAYYRSKQFRIDTFNAAALNGLKMGTRQVLGLVFAEIWFSIKDELEKHNDSEESIFYHIADGIKKGYENAKEKYKELLQKFLDGAISGVLSSLVTTLTNIFTATAKRTVRIIRQCSASLIDGLSVLLMNPDYLPFGERVKAGTKIFATGACIVAGQMVSELIEETALGKIPVFGDILSNFLGILVTGILTCTLLRIMDRSTTLAKIVDVLNKIPTPDDVVRYYIDMSYALDYYYAKLQEIDFKELEQEIDKTEADVKQLDSASDENEFNLIITRICEDRGYSKPWGNEDPDVFMSNPDNQLVFN